MNTIIKVFAISIVFTIINSVSASESGLLLGLRYGTNYDASASLLEKKVSEGVQQPSSYRTFWIRAKDGEVELAAERTNLLLPREDGFWRLDVKHSIYNDFSEDFIWVNAAPDSDALPNPFLAEQEGIDAFDVSLLVKEQGVDSTFGEYCNGHASRNILFIGNDNLSVGYTHNEMCTGFMEGSTGSALQMLSLEELEAVDITTVLDSSGSEAFKRAANDYKTQNSNDQEWGEASFGIVRHQGRWVIKGHFPIEEGGYTQFDVPVALPKSIVGNDTLYPDWQTIKKLVPDAVDAFSSPSKDLLVVLTESSLFAFSVNNEKVSQQPALHILFKQPVTVIMERWAEGQYVSNWMEEIQNIGPKPKLSWFTKAEIFDAKEIPKTVGVVVTKSATLNIRQDIGKHTKPIGKAKKGSTLNVLDIFGEWYKVQRDDGIIGYTHSDYVKILPRLPYVKSACPVDNCAYGKWKLKQPTTLYAEPSFKADALEGLKTQQVVQALSGEVHTSKFGEIVVKHGVELVDDNQKLVLQEGDVLFDLEPVGLDMHVVWYNGNLHYLNNGWSPDIVSDEEKRWGTEITKRKTDWWVKVEVPEKNLSGWIANPNSSEK
ncbi:SH3 domain-containing protein [Candidatus Parabeggiatoa sp. HSG14]|uniref:SH3 domain-containing protein n=1 Tax=Candidatus Parabeggiatoa sp. HSG14 TaxID=3055593 RepID=UPI0025A6E2F9|nr:SH3 domain-containing protein [Thiotrichales bacterium HSG14]